ncbi:MAG: hypothetical protein IPK07_02685 [Deltaproteobacteria bacterium]|nr:hypothetical protein [Deltaproteobacteria bacterium]
MSRAFPGFTARIPVVRIARRLLRTWGTTAAQFYAPSIVYFHDDDKDAGYGPAPAPPPRRVDAGSARPDFFAAAPTLTAAPRGRTCTPTCPTTCS